VYELATIRSSGHPQKSTGNRMFAIKAICMP